VIVVNIVLRQAQKFAGALLALGIDIADRRDLDAIFGLQHPDVGETHSTDADDADVNAVVGAEHAGRRQRGGSEEFAARGHCILPAKPSRSLASSTSLALTPPASCVVRSTITLFQTLNHSGWWFIFSMAIAEVAMNPKAWMKSANLYSRWSLPWARVQCGSWVRAD